MHHRTAETWGTAEETVEGMAAAYTAERDIPSRIRMAVAGKQAGQASPLAEALLTLQRPEAGSQAAEVSQPRVGCTLACLGELYMFRCRQVASACAFSRRAARRSSKSNLRVTDSERQSLYVHMSNMALQAGSAKEALLSP